MYIGSELYSMILEFFLNIFLWIFFISCFRILEFNLDNRYTVREEKQDRRNKNPKLTYMVEYG